MKGMPQNTPPPPWTPTRVAELNTEQQRAGTSALHCGTPRHENVPLTATLTGWRCPLGCGYNPRTVGEGAEPDQAPPTTSRHRPPDAQCGEECSQGHVYAGRCAMLTPVNPADDAPDARLQAAEHLLAELRHLHTRGPGQLRTPAGMLNADDVCRSCCVQWPCPTGRLLGTASAPVLQEQP